MTFEYIVEKENKTHKMSKDEVKQLAERISSDFENYNSRRRQNLNQSEELIDEIFFKKSFKTVDPKDKYNNLKTKVRMCKTYMFYQVLKAFIWKNVYANTSSMFDVAGENQESDNDSNKQKAVLVDKFEKMGYSKTYYRLCTFSR